MQAVHDVRERPPARHSRACDSPDSYSRTLRKRSALVMTDTELRLMTAAASIGLSNRPVRG